MLLWQLFVKDTDFIQKMDMCYWAFHSNSISNRVQSISNLFFTWISVRCYIRCSMPWIWEILMESSSLWSIWIRCHDFDTIFILTFQFDVNWQCVHNDIQVFSVHLTYISMSAIFVSCDWKEKISLIVAVVRCFHLILVKTISHIQLIIVISE